MSPVTLPNLITVARLIAVPVVVWLITIGRIDLAFFVFVAAGVSDAIDGWIARRFDLRSELGAFLDPIADKALLVTLYVTLGITGGLPLWLVILVVTRDVLIVGAVLLTWVMGYEVKPRPLFISKANTAGQIVLVAVVLADLAGFVELSPIPEIGVYVVGTLTVLSGAAYVMDWLTAMSTPGDGPGAPDRPDGGGETS